jgi:hypothetical protein
MRFRAILHDPGNANAERPVQILSNSRKSTGDIIGIDEWAAKVLQGAISDDAYVDVYQTSEERVAIINKFGIATTKFGVAVAKTEPKA